MTDVQKIDLARKLSQKAVKVGGLDDYVKALVGYADDLAADGSAGASAVELAVFGHGIGPAAPGTNPYDRLPADSPAWYPPDLISHACSFPKAATAELLSAQPSSRGHRCVIARCRCSCHN